MFRKIFFMAVFLLSISAFASPLQTDSCQFSISMSPSIQVGGLFVTASGTINVLCVYVQFPDDNWLPSSSWWPKGQAPSYMNSTIDSIWSATPTPGSITDYFNQMSFNTLKMTGKVISVITPHTRKWYLDNGWRSTEIYREMLQQLDATMDFAQYDNWHFNSSYSHTNSADGIVDMILMMWRNIDADTTVPVTIPPTPPVRTQLNLVPGGEASLGGDYTGCISYNVDNGLRTIKTCYGSGGSGITAIQPNGSDLSPWTLWRYARHEFAHWLLGGNEFHTQSGTWGILSSWGTPSDCINSFERERLGWMNPNTIDDISTTRTIANITLPDFVTTGVAYKIKVPGGSSDEYYLIENHQKISSFDVPDANYSNTKGLYIIKQKGTTGNGTGVITGEGRYNWSTVAMEPNIYGSSPAMIPVFQRGTSNRASGYSRRQAIPWSYPGYSGGQAVIHYERINGVTIKAGQDVPPVYLGTGKDQFDLAYNTVFSPASNPSSDLYSNTNKIGFEITGYNSSTGVYTLNIHINNVETASPSKPQDAQIQTYNGDDYIYPKITWSAMLEPDVVTGGNICIERSIKNMSSVLYTWSSWSNIATLIGTATSYTDQGITTAGMSDDSVRYRIRAKDSQNYYSVYSDIVKLNYSQWLFKQGRNSNAVPTENELSQSYPNPFNPTTVLSYQLSAISNMSLKIYDMLGREVAVLANGTKEAGYYTATFNASNLASGIYFAQFNAIPSNGTKPFMQVRKLLLTK